MEWWQGLLVAIAIGWAGWVSINLMLQGRSLGRIWLWIGRANTDRGRFVEKIDGLHEKIDRQFEQRTDFERKLTGEMQFIRGQLEASDPQ